MFGVVLVLSLFALLDIVRFDTGRDITTFRECIARGFVMGAEYPRTCTIRTGKVFRESTIQEVGHTEFFVVDTPKSSEMLTNPLYIRGLADPAWFADQSFLLRLVADGVTLAQTNAVARPTALDVYSPFRAFSARLSFAVKETTGATLEFVPASSSLMSSYTIQRIPIFLTTDI